MAGAMTNTAAWAVATTCRARSPTRTCSGARSAVKRRIDTRPSSRTSKARRGGCGCGCRCWFVFSSGCCGFSSAWPRYSSFPWLSSWPSRFIRRSSRWASNAVQRRRWTNVGEEKLEWRRQRQCVIESTNAVLPPLCGAAQTLPHPLRDDRISAQPLACTCPDLSNHAKHRDKAPRDHETQASPVVAMMAPF